jgi:PAS domain S-box-containing protein
MCTSAVKSELAAQIMGLRDGDHLCLFYNRAPAEQMPALIPFIREGLAKNEQFVYIADDQTCAQLIEYLRATGIDADAEIRFGKLILWTRNEWRPSGEFTTEKMVDRVRAMVMAAVKAGLKGIRFAVEMTWALGPDIEAHKLAHWEATVNTLLTPAFPGRVICQFNRSRISPEVLMAALHTHPLVIVDGEVYPNVFCEAPLILNGKGHAPDNDNGHSHAPPDVMRERVDWMISQLKRARVAQQDREELIHQRLVVAEAERLNRFLSLMPVGVYTCDADGLITYFNKRAVELWGREPKLNDSAEKFCACYKVFLPDGTYIPPNQTPMAIAVREGKSFSGIEAMVERPNGTRFLASVNIDVIRDPSDKIEGAVNVFQDISARKTAEMALQVSEARFRAHVTASSNAVYSMSPDWREMRHLKGLDFIADTTHTSKVWLDQHIPLDDQPRVLEAIQTATRTKSMFALEHRVKRPDGSFGWTFSRAVPMLDEHGEITEWIGSASDITERKLAAEKAARLASIVEQSDDAIISKDFAGIVQTWNKAAEKIFGYTAAEMVGNSITILIPPERLDEEPGVISRIRAGEHINHYETVRRRKDGLLIDVSVTISPIRDTNGGIIGASKIARDISDKKRYETALREARDRAEEASRAKDRFLAALSHELRTPLNPVLLIASDAAVDPGLAPAIRADFDLIRRNVELEARLIDDLLDLSGVRIGKMKVDLQALNVHSVLSEAIAIVQTEMEQKGITLLQKLGGQQSIICGDKVRLQQVFWNVLKNAIKFTPSGGTITIETIAAQQNYVVTIADTGIGMSREELNRIFEAFQQGDHSTAANSFGGLGLGLAISKNLVDLHSGKIEAASQGRGRGSKFTIAFPLAKPEAMNGRAPSPQKRSNKTTESVGLRVLLVEDHEATRSILARLLTNRHHQVTVAGSVKEAVDLGKRAGFDIVVSDIGLPDGNGHDLFKTILQHSPRAKGIALTGYGMDDDLALSQETGFSVHLTKPVRIDALDAALASVTK